MFYSSIVKKDFFMNRIAPVKLAGLNSQNKINFKGNDEKQAAQTQEQGEKLKSSQDALACLGRSAVESASGKYPKNDDDGLMRTKDGELFSGTITKEGNGYHKKVVMEYKDGKPIYFTRYSEDDSDEIEVMYEYIYPNGDNKTKEINVYRMNDFSGELCVWQKITMTPEIVAVHDIGPSDSNMSILTIKDRKTGKKRCKYLLKPNLGYGYDKLPDKFERELKYAANKLVPIEKREYYEDGKTIKEKTQFENNLQRCEISYDRAGNKTKTLFLDKFNRPIEMNYYGVTEKPILINSKNAPKKVPYRLQVVFLTNRTSDSLERYSRYVPSNIISAGKVWSATLSFDLPEETAIYKMQNWFHDGRTERIIDIQHPASRGNPPIEPEKTTMDLFNRYARHAEGCLADCDREIGEFLDEYENGGIYVRRYLTAEQGTTIGTYFGNPQTGELAIPRYDHSGISPDVVQQINEIYKEFMRITEEHEEHPGKRHQY